MTVYAVFPLKNGKWAALPIAERADRINFAEADKIVGRALKETEENVRHSWVVSIANSPREAVRLVKVAQPNPPEFTYQMLLSKREP